MANHKERLEYLRGEIENESISYYEVAELRSLANFIEDDDTLLLKWAGVPDRYEKMSVEEHYHACVLNMDNDERLYTRGVAIATVFRKYIYMPEDEMKRLIDSYADDIVATTNLNETAHPHMAVDGTQEEVKALVVKRIKELFAEWDEEFASLEAAIKEAK